VDPVQPARDPSPGLVEVGHRRGRQLPTHGLNELLQPPGALGHHRGQRADGHARAQHVGQQLRGPVHRQVLVGAQVAHQRAHSGPVAGRRADMGGEGRSGRAPAGAAAPFGPVLGDPKAERGQVEHLPGLHSRHWRAGPLRAAAGHTARAGAPRPRRGWRPGPDGRRARRAACRASALDPLGGAASGPRGLAKPVRGQRLGRVRGVLPRRRSNSATRACSVAIRRACSALAARSSTMTAAWTATVASRSGWGEGIAASTTSSGHARLPIGRSAQLPQKPQPVNSCTSSPRPLHLVEAQPARR
jgi:hypothetical protein